MNDIKRREISFFIFVIIYGLEINPLYIKIILKVSKTSIFIGVNLLCLPNQLMICKGMGVSKSMQIIECENCSAGYFSAEQLLVYFMRFHTLNGCPTTPGPWVNLSKSVSLS